MLLLCIDRDRSFLIFRLYKNLFGSIFLRKFLETVFVGCFGEIWIRFFYFSVALINNNVIKLGFGL